ncbi:hypothetical protein ACFLU6_12000, partial [Acidobacteriota bacterium]
DERNELYYRLSIRSERGFRPDWIDPGSTDKRYLGCRLVYLGRAEKLEADLYKTAWDVRALPERLDSSITVKPTIAVKNVSRRSWPPPGMASMVLRAWWVKEGKKIRACDIEINRRIKPGGKFTARPTLKVPDEPGEYSLTMDLGFRRLWWFSERNPACLKVLPVQVVKAP